MYIDFFIGFSLYFLTSRDLVVPQAKTNSRVKIKGVNGRSKALWDKTRSFLDIKIHFPISEGVSEVSERANE